MGGVYSGKSRQETADLISLYKSNQQNEYAYMLNMVLINTDLENLV
jgi:hypothetical protein